MADDPLEEPGTGAGIGAAVGGAGAGIGAGIGAAATGAAVVSGPVGWIALGGAALGSTAGKMIDHSIDKSKKFKSISLK